jgi:small subunit ribosomal protein S7
MKNGKKTKAHLIMAKTLTRLCEDTQMGSMDSIRFLTLAIDNVKPVLEVTKMRIAGSTQFVPKMIPQNRQESLAIRWLIEAAQAQKRRHATKKTGQTLTNNDGSHSVHSKTDLSSFLVLELIDAYNQVGSVKQKRDELHQLAEANRGFSHYRWW